MATEASNQHHFKIPREHLIQTEIGILDKAENSSGFKISDENLETTKDLAANMNGAVFSLTNGDSANGSANGANGSMNGAVTVNGDNAPYQGIDLTADAADATFPISWHEPHPIFVIILVGPEELPFGIQKDLLCAKSPYYREEFSKNETNLELVVKLPETDVVVFGCFQVFLYTGKVYDKENGKSVPEYGQLLGVWALATKLRMPNLRVAVLDAFAERRELTNSGPGTALLIKAWQETEEGSGLRRMLIAWVAEHMHTAPAIRNQFAKALPQDILSELVVAMAEYSLSSPVQEIYTPPQPQAPLNHASEINLIEPSRSAIKRPRKSEVSFVNGTEDTYEVKPVIKKPARRSDSTSSRKPNRRVSSQVAPIPMDGNKELNYCRDLIGRMMSGPGFWTRLVGPFKDPVDPILHSVPNYFDVIKTPMDLRTIHAKMSRNEYATAAEFEADVRLIFQNCYEYWTENDKPFKDCIAFEKYFNDQWGHRQSWRPSIKAEVVE